MIHQAFILIKSKLFITSLFYNRIFNIQHKFAGYGSVFIDIPSL